MAIDGSQPYFAGHYPDRPIFPGVFIVEAAQNAVFRYAAALGKCVRLREVRSARFRMVVEPADILECSCECSPAASGAGLDVKAKCNTGKGLVAELKLHFDMEAVSD